MPESSDFFCRFIFLHNELIELYHHNLTEAVNNWHLYIRVTHNFEKLVSRFHIAIVIRIIETLWHCILGQGRLQVLGDS